MRILVASPVGPPFLACNSSKILLSNLKKLETEKKRRISQNLPQDKDNRVLCQLQHHL